jgi:hypothetical protein
MTPETNVGGPLSPERRAEAGRLIAEAMAALRLLAKKLDVEEAVRAK